MFKDSGMKKFTLILVVSLICLQVSEASVWRNGTYTNTLENSSLRARFQAGNLYELTDLATAGWLVRIERVLLPVRHCRPVASLGGTAPGAESG